MALVIRKLQHATWEFDTDTGEVKLKVHKPNEVTGFTHTNYITLNKTYSYSLGRFLIRTWQKMTQKHRKSPTIKQAIAEATSLKKGFTFIELFIVIALMGALFIGIAAAFDRRLKRSVTVDSIDYDCTADKIFNNEFRITCK